MLRAYFGVFLLIAFSITNGVSAAMNSTNYQINFDSINSGGTDFSSSTNFQMSDTLGEQGTGYTSSTNYVLHAGYRQYDEQIDPPTLEFILGAQENDTQTAYTAFSIAGKTVTVADASDFASGTRIGVVENQGLAESFVVGRVIDVTGLVLTVDKWDGMTGTITESPSGGNDFVYRLEGHTIAFGTIDTLGAAGIVHTEVSTNAANGYTLQIQSDGYLEADPTHRINDVADGTVTAGSNEYGARVYGTTATSTGYDFPVTTSYLDIQKSTTTAVADRVGMIYKVSMDYTVAAGNYQQTVAYLLTPNF
ncbi:MAG: hypothetical protein P1P90_02325 [Patescibacteria group bacterium]|nr:hypothetical protein [Patescibacteria group bacterium]